MAISGFDTMNVWDVVSQWVFGLATDGFVRHPIFAMWQSVQVTPRCAMALPAKSSAFGILASPASVWHCTQSCALSIRSWRGSHLPWKVWQGRQKTSALVEGVVMAEGCPSG